MFGRGQKQDPVSQREGMMIDFTVVLRDTTVGRFLLNFFMLLLTHFNYCCTQLKVLVDVCLLRQFIEVTLQ